MFQEAALLDRFQLAAQAGFRAVELQAPYAEPAALLAERLREANLEAVLINTPAALAAVPGEQARFRAGFRQALAYADALDCQQIHCLAGRSAGAAAAAAFLENLRWAADQAAPRGVRLLLEPLNTIDNPGYFLTGSAQARRIIDQLERENVRLQCDFYHLQLMEGRLAQTLADHFEMIGHIQISGVPGRHEPDQRQEINYPFLLSIIDELGFEGWVGCEYRPRAGTLEGLQWARPYGLLGKGQ